MPTEDEIFRIAFALPTAETRLEHLNQVCRDAVEQERIVALLKEGSSDMSFLEKPPADLTEDLPDAVSMEGESVGSYKLLQPIGEGGFGIVYMAEQTKPVRRKVALKVIKPGMDTKQVVVRFEAERQALAMMDHPNDNRAVPKIIDFGVSKAVSLRLTEKTLFTAYGQMVGTPVYMSPEQAQMSGLDIDTRADIYSLGVLLYGLLTGTTPLEASGLRGTAYAELQRMIMEDESIKPSTRHSTLGDQLAIDCALHPNGRDVAAGPLGARHLVTWDVFDTDVDGLPKFSNPEHFGKHVSFSPDGRWLACGSAPVSVWDLHVPATDRTAKIIGANTHELKVEFSPCGRYLAAATAPLSNASKTDVVIFDASKLDENETKEISLRRLELETRVTGFAFHPNGDSLAFVDRVGSITVIPTIADGKEAHTSWMASKHPLTDIAYTPKLIATSGRDETIRIWEVATQQLVHSIVDEGFVYCVEFGRNGKTLVAGNDLGSVNVWDTSFLDSLDHRIEDMP